MKFFIIIQILLLAIFANEPKLNDLAMKKIKAQEKIAHKNFSFVFLGDNRGGDEVFKGILQKINREKEIKFIINGGDIVPNGYQKQYKEYLKLVKVSKKPILNLMGNHEVKWFKGRRYFERFIGDRYFSFSFKDAYFIILDNSNLKSLDTLQKIWLLKELKRSQRFRNRFVFMHTPLYDPREGVLKRGHSLKDIKSAEELNLLFKKYRVSLLFCSHIHSLFQGQWRGVKYIISGGAGAPLYHSKSIAFYHYIRVDITSTGFKTRVIQVDIQEPPKWRVILKRVGEYLNIW